MITETLEHLCPKCQSKQIVKNGRTEAGKQKYHCRACGAYGTLNPTVAYTLERKAEILNIISLHQLEFYHYLFLDCAICLFLLSVVVTPKY